ncbi:MAG: N utilization substance protein B [Flavobacteriaceae bacterium]|jgi:N utilization substance protein B
MANRHLSRSIALQTIFEWDFKGMPQDGVTEILARNITEFAPGLEDVDFIETIMNLVVAKRTVVEEIIEKAAPDWPLAKINAVDRSILRLGLTELLFGDYSDVPPKVAINEAIELAKTFGGDSSGRFINGVLGAVYREMGEPEKDQTSGEEKEIPIDQKAAAVVYGYDGEILKFAMVHDVFGYWTLSKGGIEEGEDVKEGLARALKQEIGLDLEIKEEIGENEYIANHPERGKVRKHVQYFLAETPFVEISLKTSGGLDDARWFNEEEVLELSTYEDIALLIKKALSIIKK